MFHAQMYTCYNYSCFFFADPIQSILTCIFTFFFSSIHCSACMVSTHHICMHVSIIISTKYTHKSCTCIYHTVILYKTLVCIYVSFSVHATNSRRWIAVPMSGPMSGLCIYLHKVHVYIVNTSEIKSLFCHGQIKKTGVLFSTFQTIHHLRENNLYYTS
jgi:hypothetical protein